MKFEMVMLFVLFLLCNAQTNMLIDIGGEKIKMAVYGEKKSDFRLVESNNGKQEIPSIITLDKEGDVQFGDQAERVIGHKGVVNIKYPMLLNSITQKLNEEHKLKRYEWVFRDGDGINVLEDEPLKLKIGEISTSYGFLISAFIDEIIDHIDIKDANVKTDFPNVLSVPSFYNNKQLDLLYNGMNAITTNGNQYEEGAVGNDMGTEITDVDGELKNLEKEVKEIKEDKIIEQKPKKEVKKTDKKKVNKKKPKKEIKGLRKTKQIKQVQEDDVETENNDEENDLDFTDENQFDLNEDDEEEFELQADIDDKPNNNQILERIKETTLFVPNHLVHALAYYATERNGESNDKPIIIIEFGASYCRATKFIIKGKKTIKILQHEVDFNINTRKLNHNLMLMLLKKFVNREEIIEKIKSMPQNQLSLLWKNVDQMRVQLSANDKLITEFMDQKVIIDQKEFYSMITEELTELNKMLLSLRSKEQNDIVYITGGLSYTPILKEKVGDVFGSYLNRIGNKQMLEGMKLYGMMFPLDGVITSASNLPFIEDILPFGLYVKIDDEKIELFNKNHQFEDGNVEDVDIDPKGAKYIELCTYPVGGIEYDADNCFDMYEVNGEVHLKIVPLSEGFVKSITATNGVKRIKKEREDLISLIRKRRSDNEVVQNQITKKVEYQSLLMKYRDSKEVKKDSKFIDFINNELELLDNEKLYPFDEINNKIIELKKMYDELVNGVQDDNKIDRDLKEDEMVDKPQGNKAKTVEDENTNEKPKNKKENRETIKQLRDNWEKHLKENANKATNNGTDVEKEIKEKERLIETAKETIASFKEEMKKKGVSEGSVKEIFNKLEGQIKDKTITNTEFIEAVESIKKHILIDSRKSNISSNIFLQFGIGIVCCVFIVLIVIFLRKARNKSSREVELESIRDR